MATGTLYAWSPIRVGEPGTKDGPGDIKMVKFGEEVTADSLGVSNEEFAGMVNSGSVRTMKPPEVPATFQGSPIDFLKEQAARASEDATNAVMASPEVMAAITASNQATVGTGLSPENVDPDVLEEQQRQQSGEEPSSAATEETSNSTTQFRSTSDGLFASDDNGESWRPATDEEKANQ